MTCISHVDKKPDIDIQLNEVVAPKNENGDYGSKDYLCKLQLSVAPLESQFIMAFHFCSCYDSKTDTGNKTKHQYIKEAFISNIPKKKPGSGAINMT